MKMSKDEADALKISPMVVNLVNNLDYSNKKIKEEEFKNASQTKEEFKGLFHVASTGIRVLKPAIEEDCYRTDSTARGMCVVLEHSEFKPSLHLSERRGSEVDLKAVNECFSKLGFEVFIKRNLRVSEVNRLLEEVAMLDHRNYQCFALVVLSHGSEGTVYAFDGAYPTQRLWETLAANNCPSLIGKPKLIFIQACQGAKMDPGIAVVKATATDSFASYKVPTHADFVVAQSTVAGFYSWRNTAAGSWYIQSLSRVLSAEYCHRDLLSILTMVQKIVAEEYESNSGRLEFNGKKQTPFVFSTLTRKFYLTSKTE